MARGVTAAFPRSRRVRRRGEFLAIQRSGRRWRSPSFVVIRRTSPTGQTRLGVTVSRRVGNAVERNRVKRLVREAFRTSAPELVPAQDIVVIARSGAHELEYAEVAAELRAVFQPSGAPS